MADDRWSTLGLAGVRDEWFSSLASAANSGVLPLEFVKCVSGAEVNARLSTGRRWSAVIVAGDHLDADRDLIDTAAGVGAAVIVVGRGRADQWVALGAHAVLDTDFGRAELLEALRAHATPLGSVRDHGDGPTGTVSTAERGALVAVTGAGGMGVSTTTAALAASTARLVGPSATGVVLADLDPSGDQAMLHDSREIIPGVPELVESCRHHHPSADEVRQLCFRSSDDTYDLLLGLRRPREWTALRRAAFATALDSLRQAYSIVVADVADDFEGFDDCGSHDVEDRNLMARTVCSAADVVVAVALCDPKGVERLVRTIRRLGDHGVDPQRIVPTFAAAPRSRRRKAELTATLAELAGGVPVIDNPVFVPRSAPLAELLRDRSPVPAAPARSLARAVQDRRRHLGAASPVDDVAVAVAPGSLGTWTTELSA